MYDYHDDITITGCDGSETELKAPPGCSYNLWEADLEPRELTKFKYPKKWAHPKITWVDEAIKCPNGLLLYPERVIPGYHALSLKKKSKELSQRYYWYSKLSGHTVRIYNEAVKMLRAREGGLRDLTLSEFYGLFTHDSAHVESMIAREMNKMTTEKKLQRMRSKLKAEAEEGQEFKAVITKVQALDELSYIDLTATHLFIVAGGKDLRVYEDQFVSPVGVALAGQELWLVMHLIHPRLNQLYRKVIVPKVRSAELWAQSYMFSCGESFAVDFWQTWFLAISVYQVKFINWFRIQYHPESSEPDSDKLRSEVREFHKLSASEPVTEEHINRFRSGMYFMAGLMEANPTQYDQQDLVRVAFQIKVAKEGHIRTF